MINKCKRCNLKHEENERCKLTLTLLETMRKEAVSQFPAKGERIMLCDNPWHCHPTPSKKCKCCEDIHPFEKCYGAHAHLIDCKKYDTI